MNKYNINNIIFDLGKVIVDVDESIVYQAFKDSSGAMARVKFSDWEEYLLFETGKKSEEDFFNQVKQTFRLTNTSLSEIKELWDSMIIGVSPEKISLLKSLIKRYRLFALSNTNSSHVKIINNFLWESYQIERMSELFEKVYYSYEIGLDKPNKVIFEYVICDANIIPEQTLFVDDNYQSILTASQLGFKTIHLINPNQLLDKLKQMNIAIDIPIYG